jgi:hypothetical protein
MTEERIRRELADAVADEPPLWLDIDAVIDSGERQARRRRSLVGAAALTGTVTALATALSLMLAPAGPAPPADRPGGTSQPSQPRPGPPLPSATQELWPGPLSEAPAYARAQYQEVAEIIGARLQTALRNLPGAEEAVAGGNERTYVPGAGEQTWEFTALSTTRPGALDIGVTVTASGRPYQVNEEGELLVFDHPPAKPGQGIDCLVGGYRKIAVFVWGVPSGESPLSARHLEAFCRDLVL